MSPTVFDRLNEAVPAPVSDRLERVSLAPVVATLVAVLSGLVVFLVASTVFAYHSSNHDEAVYLMQAAMVLEGQLELHAGDLAGAFRPWFFIADSGRLYPKYTPVHAAMYAVSMVLFDEPRVTLAAIAACNTGLVYTLGSMVFDRRTGSVAAILFTASPLALVTSAVFLPYAPTTFLNLLFAVAYLYSVREESFVAAAIAGLAIGLAFFARPFTAVLFATPFILHALYRVGRSCHEEGLQPVPDTTLRHGLTAAGGLLFVGVTLCYNYRMTGSLLVFPYEVFAPLDGPGFGSREILDHSIEYTPRRALRANGYVLWYLVTRWFVAGSIGTLLAGAGATLAVRRWLDGDTVAPNNTSFERTGGLLLGALFVTVSIGNVFFWGNFNILSTFSDPTDGLIAQFGPFYHFDLLVPLSLFAAVAAVACWRSLRATLDSHSSRTAQALLVSLVVVAVLAFVSANAAVAAGPLDRNAAHTDKYDRAYDPIETAEFNDALVFVPTPYGEWQSHPFQYLRNDPGFDGPVVYALDRDPAEDFAVVDAYPDRTYYRYSYRGEWTPNADRHVEPMLEELSVHRGERFDSETVVGVPDRVERARVRLESDGESVEYSISDPDRALTVPWTLDGDGVRLDDPDTSDSLAVEDTDTVVILVTLVEQSGATLTYRQEVTVRTTGDGVEVVWPPERSVCTLVTDCGNEGTYIADDPDAYPDGVSFETHVVADETWLPPRKSGMVILAALSRSDETSRQ